MRARQRFDRTLAYEDIPTGGSVIVLGPQRDMLHLSRNFLEFFLDESCGQCTPCREGIPKLLEGVELLKHGRCSMGYLKELCDWAKPCTASKCGLGQSAPNALLSIVEHFQDEILAAWHERRPHRERTIDHDQNCPSTRAPGLDSQRFRPTARRIAQAKAIGKQIAVTIDGNSITVPLGTTILEAARRTRDPHPHALLP